MNNRRPLPDHVAFETLSVRAGSAQSQAHERSEALYQSSRYCYSSAAEAAADYANDSCHPDAYATNPNVSIFEERMLALEGAEAAVATATGIAAVLAVCMAHLKNGDHVVCSRAVPHAVATLFTDILARLGVITTFVDLDDLDDWLSAINDSTRMLYVATPTAPLGVIADLDELAELAQCTNALLVVDNSLCTPALQQPLAWQADIVVYSDVSYLDGHGCCAGGIALGSQVLIAPVRRWQQVSGTGLSPFAAWQLANGLETLKLRMDAHCRNAQQLAWFLAEHPLVIDIHYSGLPFHPSAVIARRQQQGYGAVLSFEVAGGREAAWKVIDTIKIMSCSAGQGDTRTTISHPSSTTHAHLSDRDKRRAGIYEGLICITVGLENVDDLKNDLDQALAVLEV